MKRKSVWLSLLMSGFLTGCGAGHGARPISHGMTPTQVKTEVLARLKAWHAVSETVAVTLLAPHQSKRHQYQVTYTSQKSPASFRLQLVPKSGATTDVVDNGLNTVQYVQGSQHYSVAASGSNAWGLYQLTGLELQSVLKSSKVLGVSVTSKEVALHLLMPIAPGIMAKGTLWFDLVSNLPSRLSATWKGGSVTETPSNIHVNPSISASAFVFTPPSGVSPEVALTAQGTEIDQAQARVAFPIILPAGAQNLQLNNVNVNTSKGRRVVLLSYQTQDKNPLVITESKGTPFKAPQGLSMVTERVGTLKIEVGSLPDGQEMAGLIINKTLIVAEGPQNTVDGLVNSWAGTKSASSSSP